MKLTMSAFTACMYDCTFAHYIRFGHSRHFQFDQVFQKFHVGELMEQTFSGISFRNFVVRHKVGLKLWKIAITRKFRSI